MKSTLAAAIVLALGITVAPVQAAAPPATGAQVANAADQRLIAIADAEYLWRHADAPGQQRDRSRLGDVSEAAQLARLAGWQQVLVELDGIDPAQLSA